MRLPLAQVSDLSELGPSFPLSGPRTGFLPCLGSCPISHAPSVARPDPQEFHPMPKHLSKAKDTRLLNEDYWMTIKCDLQCDTHPVVMYLNKIWHFPKKNNNNKVTQIYNCAGDRRPDSNTARGLNLNLQIQRLERHVKPTISKIQTSRILHGASKLFLQQIHFREKKQAATYRVKKNQSQCEGLIQLLIQTHWFVFWFFFC